MTHCEIPIDDAIESLDFFTEMFRPKRESMQDRVTRETIEISHKMAITALEREKKIREKIKEFDDALTYLRRFDEYSPYQEVVRKVCDFEYECFHDLLED